MRVGVNNFYLNPYYCPHKLIIGKGDGPLELLLYFSSYEWLPLRLNLRLEALKMWLINPSELLRKDGLQKFWKTTIMIWILLEPLKNVVCVYQKSGLSLGVVLQRYVRRFSIIMTLLIIEWELYLQNKLLWIFLGAVVWQTWYCGNAEVVNSEVLKSKNVLALAADYLLDFQAANHHVVICIKMITVNIYIELWNPSSVRCETQLINIDFI